MSKALSNVDNLKIILNLPRGYVNKKNDKVNYIGFIFGPRGGIINGIQNRTDTIIKLHSENNSKLIIIPNLKRISDSNEIFNKLNLSVNIIISMLKSCYEKNKYYTLLQDWQHLEKQINIQVMNNMKRHNNNDFKLLKKKIVIKLINTKKISKNYYTIPILDTIKKELFLNSDYLESEFNSELNINYTVSINDNIIYIENFNKITDEIEKDRALKINTPTNLTTDLTTIVPINFIHNNIPNLDFDKVIRPNKWNPMSSPSFNINTVTDHWDPMSSPSFNINTVTNHWDPMSSPSININTF